MPRKNAPTLNREQHAYLLRLVSVSAIVIAIGLVLLKLYVWQKTNSLSMLSSLMDSVLDVGMSAVSFFAVRTALIPADNEHRFGHGKAEALAALSQSLLIVISCILLVGEAVQRAFVPHPIQSELLGIAAMAISIVATMSLVRFQNYVVTKTGSVAIAADRTHYETDTVVNVTVLFTIAAVYYSNLYWLDAVMGGVVAVYLAWCSRKIFILALDVLLDRELPDVIRARVENIIRTDPDVVDFHDLRTRMAGPNYFIQFHLELDSQMTLESAHHIADRIEHAIMTAFPQSQVSIHQEPAGINDHRDNF